MKSKNFVFMILGINKKDYPITKEFLINKMENKIKKISNDPKNEKSSEINTQRRLELISMLQEKVEEYVKPANLAIINSQKSFVMDIYNTSKSENEDKQMSILELTAKIIENKKEKFKKEKFSKKDLQKIILEVQNESKSFRDSLLNSKDQEKNSKSLIVLDQTISNIEKLKIFYMDNLNFEILNKIKDNINENIEENTHYEPTFKLERTSIKEIKSINDVIPKGIIEDVLSVINGKNLDFFVCENDKNQIYNSRGEKAAKKDIILSDGNISFEKKGVVEIGAVAGIVKHYIGKYDVSYVNIGTNHIHKEHSSIYGIINFSKYREDEKYRGYVLTRILDARAKEEINIGEITEDYKSIYSTNNLTRENIERKVSFIDRNNRVEKYDEGSERDYV